MSVGKALAGRQFWIGQLWTLVVLLAVAALGALLVSLGLTAMDRAWIWTGVAWFAAGLCGGRFNASGEKDALLLSVINALIAMGILWLIGLTTPGEKIGEIHRWPYYVGAALTGSLVPAWPRKHKRRRKGKGKNRRRLK